MRFSPFDKAVFIDVMRRDAFSYGDGGGDAFCGGAPRDPLALLYLPVDHDFGRGFDPGLRRLRRLKQTVIASP